MRSYIDDGSYTGSVTLTDGSILSVDGIYAISGNVLTIERVTPSSMNQVLTYLSEDALPKGINPALILYLLN